MIRFFYSFFVLFIMNIANADNTEERRKEVIRIINEEIQEVAKLSRQYRHQKPELLLRTAELFLEKARLTKDAENKSYIKISPKKRSKINRKKFFAESNKYFSKAQRMCLGILKRFRSFKLKADVYYILAFNAKEFGRKKEARRYLSQVLKNSRRGSEIYKKTSLALAELQYNEKNYKKAASFYESGMSNRKDKWWTRDAFNMAWSYYKARKYSKAINLMKKIHRLSSKSQYIDMRKQVEADIGLFYISANRFDEVVEFYRSINKNISIYLYNLGKTLVNRSKLTDAEKALLLAKRDARGNMLIDINLILLELFQKHGKHKQHMNISRELFELNDKRSFRKEQRGRFILQLKFAGGVLQRKVVLQGKSGKKISKMDALLAAEYFEMISRIDREERGKYIYLKAETYFAAKIMDKAFYAYQNSYNYEKKNRNLIQAKKSIDAMLAVLASSLLKKSIKDKHYISTYNSYLELDRNSKTAESIYQRMFQQYFDKKDFKNTEGVLKAYKNRFPKRVNTQEAMIAKIMDYYKNSGDLKNFSKWARKIKNNEYKVSEKYKKSLSAVLLNMRFGSVDKLANSGDKKNALEGYLRIFHDSESSIESKKNAAHNIAVLYYELGHADDTYLWAKKSISLMEVKKMKKLSGTYTSMTKELFNMQRFDKSAILSEDVYKKLCKEKSSDKIILYQNSYIIYLASGRFDDAKRVVNSGSRCNIKGRLMDEGQFEILKVLGERKKWKEFESQLNKIKHKASLNESIIPMLALLRDIYNSANDKRQSGKLESEIEAVYNKARRKRKKISSDSLWEVAKIKLRKIVVYVRKLDEIRLEFPQKKFEQSLAKKLNLLDKISSEVAVIVKIKSGKGTMRAYQLIIESYQKTVKELRDIKLIGIKSKQINIVKKTIESQVTKPLLKKSLSYLKQARSLIAQGKALSSQNYWFLSKSRVPFNVEYHFSHSGVLMDRRGRK